MNLSKALKYKKKLITKVNRARERFSENNSRLETSTPSYDPKECYEEWDKLTKELVELKAKIVVATGPIYHKIFELSECKSKIENLKYINTTSGSIIRHHDGEVITHIAFLNEVERDNVIEDLEDRIDVLQSEIDSFNVVTQI